MRTIKIVKGDSYPEPNLTLKDSETGDKGDPDSWEAIDLSQATVRVDFYLLGGDATIAATAACTKINNGIDGEVFFRFPDAIINSEGDFEGEIIIDRSGSLETVYKRFKVKVRGR